MKLYETPDKCWIKPVTDIITPIASPDINEKESIWFNHIDGMYSYCINQNGQLVHLVAWAEVYIDEDMLDIPKPERKE